jgi:hypothetical protein
MNKLLANCAAFVNAATAVIIMATCFIAGVMSNSFAVFVLANIIGFFVTLAVCGILALLIDMRAELIQIRQKP